MTGQATPRTDVAGIYGEVLAEILGADSVATLKGVALRLHGMRIGARLFDDGCRMAERTMIAIGDDCTLYHGTCTEPCR